MRMRFGSRFWASWGPDPSKKVRRFPFPLSSCGTFRRSSPPPPTLSLNTFFPLSSPPDFAVRLAASARTPGRPGFSLSKGPPYPSLAMLYIPSGSSTVFAPFYYRFFVRLWCCLTPSGEASLLLYFGVALLPPPASFFLRGLPAVVLLRCVVLSPHTAHLVRQLKSPEATRNTSFPSSIQQLVFSRPGFFRPGPQRFSPAAP